MSKVAVKRKRASRQSDVRVGRPPRERAGEVEDRILDAARELFLRHGLGGASIDEIARMARAGKPSIYARFPTKEALFEAVAMRNAARVRAGLESENDAPVHGTVEERLIQVGATILRRLLTSDTIDFMRLTLVEANRFPHMTNVGQMARERGAVAVSQLLSAIAKSEVIRRYPAFAPDRLPATTQFFLDLVVARMLMRALFGASLKDLRAEIDTHVARGVAFFLAACRHGGRD